MRSKKRHKTKTELITRRHNEMTRKLLLKLLRNCQNVHSKLPIDLLGRNQSVRPTCHCSTPKIPSNLSYRPTCCFDRFRKLKTTTADQFPYTSLLLYSYCHNSKPTETKSYLPKYFLTWFLLILSLYNQDFFTYIPSGNFIKLVECQRFPSTHNNRLSNNQQFSFQLPFQTPSTLTQSPLNSNILNNNFPPPAYDRYNLSEIINQQGGIIRDRNVTLTKQFNPILVTKDIIIKKGAKLTIESGTEISFAKSKGIIVYGTLEILGTPNDRVKLNILKSSKSATVNFRSHNNNPYGQQLVRLVDGDLPSEGRVQIKFNDKWHTLCTNSKNLTAADIKVICQQVGYQDGIWYKWFPKRNETLNHIMSKSFDCAGNESAITQCKRWSRVRAGGGVCDYHSHIGIRCSKTLAFGSANTPHYDYWRGLEFLESDSEQEYILGDLMKQKVSKSILQHVFISDAGMNEVGNATAAIRVYGQPPRMTHIDVRNSIYGIMIEDATDAIRLSNIRLTNNMGYPLFVNTSWGKVSMENIYVENNGGDGIRVVRHEKVLVGQQLDFCKSVTHGTTETFPVIMSHEQHFFTKAGVTNEACCQEFLSDKKLTVHFPVLRSTPNNLLPESDANKRLSIPKGANIGRDAYLVIYDDYQYPPFRLRITNGTRAQSVVSRSGMLKICYEPANYRTVLFTIEVVVNEDNSWSGTANDFEISNSYINNNQGRGIWIDNPRSGVLIANTSVLNHNYLSGIHVENGTGQVILQAGRISNNTGHGLYINLAGGYYHIDNSTITDNSQKGVFIEYDRRAELVHFNHTMHLGYSLISGNGENGLFVGNVCRSDAFWNISMNSFINNGEDAIIFQSCLPTQESLLNFKNSSSRLLYKDTEVTNQNLYITHNVFLENRRRAIHMSPVFFVKSFIRHNLFREHPLAVIYISNQHFSSMDSFNATLAPTNIRISSNRFYSNRGRYVANIGVQEDNTRHSLVFTKNYLEDNEISEPFSELRPRSRVSAVVVVSSSNTKVIRNKFDNPKSEYELGSHLDVHSKVINATANFWGRNLDASSVYRRIFDRKNRYNLAQVEFLQYLLSPDDLEYAIDLSFDRERDKVTTFRNGTRIGGEIRGYEDLNPGTYLVENDIFIRPAGHLIIRPGTVLKFDDGVGLMSLGRLEVLGTSSNPISFTSSVTANRLLQRMTMTTTTTPAPIANPWVSYQPTENEPDYSTAELKNVTTKFRRQHKRQAGVPNISQNVRLSHTTMGRLEVQIDGIWGSVCDYNFDINDAAVVCQQLGMILNKDDWLLEKFQYAANDQQQLSMMSTNALMTNVRCDSSLDTDITKCKAEVSLRGEFDGMCDSEVGIRCFPPSWSGVRLGICAEPSTLEHVTIQRAGMFDYATYSLKPALQIDLNRHVISNLVVKSNSDSGLGIMWNDVIGRHFNELSIVDSKFMNNERHGLELKTKGLTINRCTMGNNRQNGVDYNPSFSFQELNDLISWLHTPRIVDPIVPINFPSHNKQFFVPPSENIYKMFIVQKNPQPSDLIETFTISTNQDHMLSIDLLNPIHPDSTESLNMTIGSNPRSPVWDFRTNMTSFPMIIPGYRFHFNYSAGSKPRGNIVIYIRSRYNGGDVKLLKELIPPHLVKPTIDATADSINSRLLNSLLIINSNITKNGIGLKFRHPNQFYEQQSYYHIRYSNETTNITGNLFESNHFSSIFVGSDDRELFSSFEASTNKTSNNKNTIPPSEIYYNIIDNKIRRNKDGIRQFSRDLRQSFNVFHWSIRDTLFENNKGGGVNILLPYFWAYDANLSHTIDFNNNSFSRNGQFEFILDGHYSEINMTRNSFRENKCKNGLVDIAGMEKKMVIRHNVMEYNACNRILQFDIQSHADKLDSIPSYFEFNIIRSNRRANSSYHHMLGNFKYPSLLPKLHPQASNFALSLLGIQSLNITRNLFVNPELRFELVVGIMMDLNEKPVNAIENYWGSVLYSEISDRIFDFDDWNNYALADLNPLLSQESLSSATIPSDEPRSIEPNINKPLGGRLTRSLRLPFRREPYIVESDLTVMPNARLTIEKGNLLEFMPNVGILVLGELMAVGTKELPIVMRPALSPTDIMPIYQYLFPSKTKPNIMKFNLNDQVTYDQNYILKHLQMVYPIDLGSVRLCKNEICNDGAHIYENNVEDPILRQDVLKSIDNTWKIDGFLEVFNMTTLKWVPVCDPLFTEHTARVVCKQLGFSHLTIFKRGRRYTMEQEQIASIKHWPESIQCDGTEANIANCPLAPNGYTNQSAACHRESNQFIYVYCQDFPDPSYRYPSKQEHSVTNEYLHHWGGVRFSCPNFAQGASVYASSDNLINHSRASPNSRLQYITIDRGGMLHRKKSPALQVFQCNVQIEYTQISNSAHHGLEILTSQGDQSYHQLRIRNNTGLGINYLPFTGSSSASKLNPYLPLKRLDLSGDIFGLVDICGYNKEIQFEDRILLYYRYNSQPVDCIKIISSRLQIKHIGIRMLQFELFNSTAFSPRPDSVKIYDGNIFDKDSRLMVEMGVTERYRIERPELKYYETSDNTISVRLHASGSSQYYGFIAELVTTPVSHNNQRNTFNNITFSELINNRLGAISVTGAGETSPNLIIKNNRLEHNCLHLFGNFTSCVAPVYMELQNCPLLRVGNNLFKMNQGGIVMKSYSHSAMGAIEAMIENNVFVDNMNTNTLALLGPKTDPYQSVKVVRNFFTRNVSPYLANIVLSRIVANFSHNIVSSNIGKHQIEVIGFDKLPLSHQTFENNWIYNNTATFERDRSTIFGNSAGQQYSYNYIVNPDNYYELSTMNWSRYDVKQYYVPRDDEIIHLVSGDGSTKDLIRKTAESVPITILDTKKLDLYQASINAKQNWWGFNTTHAIRGRIRDRYQHEELIKVDFVPYLETNRSVLNGVCAGGWQRVGNSCLVYIGSRMSYNEARDFCDKERATLPILAGNHYEFTDFVRGQERDFDAKIERIWIRSFDASRETCPALNDYRTRHFDCSDKYPFICEKDPVVVVSLLSWRQETAAIVALVLMTLLVILTSCCLVCWWLKSRHREKERIERKKTFYASIRSNRASCLTTNSISDLSLHRHMYNPMEKSSATDLSLSTQTTQPSNDNSQLVRLDPLYSSTRDRHRTFMPRNSSYVGQPKINTGYGHFQTPGNQVYVTPSPQSYVQQVDSEQSKNHHDFRQIQQQQQQGQHQQEQQRVPFGAEDDHKIERKKRQEQYSSASPEQQRLLEEQNRFNQIQQDLQKQHKHQTKPVPFQPSSRASYGSRTPSYSGSQGEGIMVEPMPMVGPVYSQINHALSALNASQEARPPSYLSQSEHFEKGALQGHPQQQIYYNLPVNEPDGSSSSVPTYYSNQIEGYEESSNRSVLEAISDAYYNKPMQSIPNDQVSYLITEKTSIKDQLTKTSTTDIQSNLVSMNPFGISDDDSMMMDNEVDGIYKSNNLSFKAPSDAGHSTKSWVETSLDVEEDRNSPTMDETSSGKDRSLLVTAHRASVYASSQRLSPVSHSSFVGPDSKHGSRVYLETSFE